MSKFPRKTGSAVLHGAEVDFQLKDKEDKLRIYTTRPDTLFGVTYMVVSPEHPYLDKVYKSEIENWDEIVALSVSMAARKSDFERTELAKEKTGVEIRGLDRSKSGKWKRNSDMGFRLCIDELRNRCYHGGSCA